MYLCQLTLDCLWSVVQKDERSHQQVPALCQAPAALGAQAIPTGEETQEVEGEVGHAMVQGALHPATLAQREDERWSRAPRNHQHVARTFPTCLRLSLMCSAFALLSPAQLPRLSQGPFQCPHCGDFLQCAQESGALQPHPRQVPRIFQKRHSLAMPRETYLGCLH